MFRLVIGLHLTIAAIGLCETYRVGLEPFPPFINEREGGLSESLLREAANSDPELEFSFERASYKRLKLELKKKKFDIIGHTPYQSEVPSFYRYAQELNWSYSVCTEFIFLNPALKKQFKPKIIGTLVGNKGFLKQFKGMEDIEVFESPSMMSLLKMLQKGRIDAVWFAKPVLAHYASKIAGLKYYSKTFPKDPLAVGFAVQKTKEGLALKKKLETALGTLNWKKKFDSALGPKTCAQ